MLERVRRWRVHRRRNQLIYQEGDPAEVLYRIEAGWVRLLVNSEDGARQIIGFLGPGDVFGFNLGPRDCGAEASTDVELTAAPLSGLLRAAEGDPKGLLKLAEACQAPYRKLVHHLQQIRDLSAVERVEACLAELSQRLAADGRGDMILPLSQLELSDFLGLSPETMSRAVAQLCSKGRLSRCGRRLVLGSENRWRSRVAPWPDIEVASRSSTPPPTLRLGSPAAVPTSPRNGAV